MKSTGLASTLTRLLCVKKAETGNKKIEILDMKRSNAINIGMKALPPLRTISGALSKMDSSVINREGIEVSEFVKIGLCDL